MKKIMFNDKYGLTEAVLEGRKTMTRRIVRNPEEVEINGHKYLQTEKIHFKVGEVVAVAQSYNDCGYDPMLLQQVWVKKPTLFPDIDPYSSFMGWVDLPMKYHKGYDNKMFVLADLMPHQIRITNIHIERLQDISDEDCIREGIVKALGLYGCEGLCERGDQLYFNTPRTAFAALIDRISGKGTWEKNPWVFVYEFELLK